MAATTAARQRPPDFIYTVINPVFKLLLRSPLHGLLSGRLMLLTFTGRKSGKRYTIPVAYVEQDDRLLVATQSSWSKNLRGSAPVSVRLRGHTLVGLANVIADEAGMRASYRMMLSKSPELGQIIGIGLDAQGEPSSADVAQARQQGHVVISIQLQ